MFYIIRSPLFERLTHFVWVNMHVMRTAIPSLLSTVLVLAYVLFCFSVPLSSYIASALRDNNGSGGNASETPIGDLAYFFGTLPRVFLSLLMAISGGDDWNNIRQPLADLDPRLSVFFIAYLVVMTFGVLNIITGMFVDQAVTLSQQNKNLKVKEQIALEEKLSDELTKIFLEADTDESGTLSLSEFEKHLEDGRVTAYLATLDLDISDTKGLFKLFDGDGEDGVPIGDLVAGFNAMRGNAKSIDLYILRTELRNHRQHFNRFASSVHGKLDGMARTRTSTTTTSTTPSK